MPGSASHSWLPDGHNSATRGARPVRTECRVYSVEAQLYRQHDPTIRALGSIVGPRFRGDDGWLGPRFRVDDGIGSRERPAASRYARRVGPLALRAGMPEDL